MNRLAVSIVICVGIIGISFGQAQTYTGQFYSSNNQGMYSDVYFNLRPQSGASASNFWNIYHQDGSMLFSVWAAATQPYIQVGGGKVTNFFLNGSMGIGNSTPNSMLDIQGQTGTSALRFQGGLPYGTYYLDVSSYGSAGAVGYSFNVKNGGGLYNGVLNFFNNNIGINTSPATKLHLKGDAPGNAVIFIEPNKWSAAGDYGDLRFGDANHYIRGEFGNGLTFYDVNKFSFQGGYVGIGTKNPDQPLTVNGVIHASEVRIDLSVPAPDYVFEKEYQLPKLEEVKTYVDANKHLPELPSAKEMEKNGIQVGEMNMILLKKVEELTLYLIEQQRRNEELEKRVKMLEGRN